MGEFFNNLCRICTDETDHVSIYSEEGRKHSLEEKIKKFLSIAVSEEDKLPKMVCIGCTSRLDSMAQFALMAARSQTKLLERLNSKEDEDEEEMEGQDGEVQLKKQLPHQEEEDGDQKEVGTNQGSLLHSILTKGQAPNETGVTELEVRIDPMLFLCDQDDDEHSNDESIPSPASTLSNENSESSDSQPSVSSHGNEEGIYKCTLCPRTFISSTSLQNHLWIHLPPTRKILVSSDFNRFQTESNLYRHKLYHSGGECLCQVCGRVYPTRSTLRAHQITHSNLRPHKCSLCDKTFKRNQDLKFHINQHTGERPYRCPYCPKAFASSGNCFSHRKRMHPKQLAKDKKQLLAHRAP